jgi:hypothetical protein
MLMISALFWGITQLRMVIVYRRFGKRIGLILKSQEIQEDFLTLEDGTYITAKRR